MTIRHRRIGPGLDVALCGARGLFMYGLTQRQITCDACKAKHASLRGTNRMAVQMAAKRAKARAGWSRSLGAMFAFAVAAVTLTACDPCKHCPTTCETRRVWRDRDCDAMYVLSGNIMLPITTCTDAHAEDVRGCR